MYIILLGVTVRRDDFEGRSVQSNIYGNFFNVSYNKNIYTITYADAKKLPKYVCPSSEDDNDTKKILNKKKELLK